MTFHTTGSDQPATGGKCEGGTDESKSPRIAVSLDPDDFRRLAWFAHKKKVPLAEMVRRAVSAYLMPIKVDADNAS
jgi:hypothetical protein